MARTFDPQHIHYSLCDRSSQLTLSDKTDKIMYCNVNFYTLSLSFLHILFLQTHSNVQYGHYILNLF